MESTVFFLFFFCFFFATIDSSWSFTGKIINIVNIDGYLFHKQHCDALHSSSESFEKIHEESPFRIQSELKKQIENGAELLNSDSYLKKIGNEEYKRSSTYPTEKESKLKAKNKTVKELGKPIGNLQQNLEIQLHLNLTITIY